VTIIDADTADRIRMAELLRRAKEQNAELQEMLSKAEDELTALRRENRLIVTISNKFYAERDVAQDRVRVLEAAIERIDAANRRHEDAMGRANEHTRDIRDAVIAALTPPPATGEVQAVKLTPELFEKRLGDFSKEFDTGYTETPALAADEAAMMAQDQCLDCGYQPGDELVIPVLREEFERLTADLDAKHAKLVEVADKLRDERAAHERTKAELEELYRIIEVWRKRLNEATAERDAAQAEAISAAVEHLESHIGMWEPGVIAPDYLLKLLIKNIRALAALDKESK
jgi:DNA repair exonuclease SbcCD ATPase subunit